MLIGKLARNDPDWRLEASCCSTLDVDFFPEKGGGSAAKRVCVACPVRVPCLVDAVDQAEEFGIWGGAGELTRRHLRNVLDEDGTHAFLVDVQDHFDRLDEFAATGRHPAGPASRALGPGATHGRASTYNRGCRCDLCKAAKMEAIRLGERRKAERLATAEISSAVA